MRRLWIYIQKRKCDKRRWRRSGAFEGGPGFFLCGLKGSRGERVVLTSKKKPPVFRNPSAGRQTEHSPTLILISLISLVWGSVLIQMGQAGKYELYSLCQERAGKKKKKQQARVSLTRAGSEKAERGVLEHGPLLLSGKTFLLEVPSSFPFSCQRETSLQGSTDEYMLLTKNTSKMSSLVTLRLCLAGRNP